MPAVPPSANARAFAGAAALLLVSAAPAMAQSGIKECAGRTGNPDRIIAACTQFIDQGPRNAPAMRATAHSNRGWVYYNREQYDLAIADFTAVIAIEPGPNGYNLRGMAYRYKPDPDKALADFDKAIAMTPDNENYFLNRGNVYLDLGQHDLAIADYDQAIRIHPKFGIAYNQRAVAHRRKGDYARAIADYSASIPINPRPATAYSNRAEAYRYSNEPERALADYDAALKLDPRNAPSYRGRALVHESRGDLARALADFRSALALNPNNQTAASGLRRVEQRLSGSAAPPAVTAGIPASPVRETRIALVIGNSKYSSVGALANPANDAQTFAQRLRGLGFTNVTLALDLPRERAMAALTAFAGEADKADWAVVYYAGHGIEMAGVNFLIPTDARLSADSDVPSEAIPLNHVLDAVEGARKLRLVILDACRDNPFLDKMVKSVTSRAINRGVGPIEPQGATLVAYAAKHGQQALDGDTANSPFMVALAKHVDAPGVEIVQLFRRVRDDVLTATQRRQEPFIYGSLPSEPFYFRLP